MAAVVSKSRNDVVILVMCLPATPCVSRILGVVKGDPRGGVTPSAVQFWKPGGGSAFEHEGSLGQKASDTSGIYAEYFKATAAKERAFVTYSRLLCVGCLALQCKLLCRAGSNQGCTICYYILRG